MQEIFDKVARHLLQQNKVSRKDGMCCYRGQDGLMCAIGCLISDDAYSKGLEGHSADDENVVAAIKNSGIDLDDDAVLLLFHLQDMHDTYNVTSWPYRLREIVGIFGLSTIALDAQLSGNA